MTRADSRGRAVVSRRGLLRRGAMAATAPPYSMSKGAVIRFTESIAAEWAAKNIPVNCIAPGAFVTDAQKAVTESPELLARRIAKIPAGRMADPSELVSLACLLASPLSTFTTGATFVVDGGESGKL